MIEEMAVQFLRWMWKLTKFLWISKLWVVLIVPSIVGYLLAFVLGETIAELIMVLLQLALIIWVMWLGLRGAIRAVIKRPEWTLWASLRALAGLASRDKTKGGAEALAKRKPAKGVAYKRPTGVVFGKCAGKWVCRPENAGDHVLVFGAPGTSKTQSVVLGSLASWQGGAFVVDAKNGELWDKVGKDQAGAMRFAVEDPDAFGFNPFELAEKDPVKRHTVARNIALTLCPANPGEKDPFWTESSQDLLTAALLTGMEQGFSFVQTMDIVASAGAETLVEWISELGGKQAAVYNASFVGLDGGKTLASVYATLHNKVSLFAVDEDVRDALSRKKVISTEDLRAGKKIYITVPEHKLEAWKHLLAMLIKLYLSEVETWPNDREQKTLFMLDEFPRLGKVSALANSLATGRSRGACIVVVCQSIAQLRTIYGRDETDAIVDLCAIKAVLSASSTETAELCSKLVGQSLQKLRSTGSNAQMFDPTKRGSSSNISEHWREVMQPAEFQHLGDVLVLIEPRSGALRIEKMPFWKYREKYARAV